MSKPKDVSYEDYDAKIKEMEEKFGGKWQELCLDLINVPSAYALDRLWEKIILARRPNYGDWEYPVQASSHIVAEWEEMERKLADLEKNLHGRVASATNGIDLIMAERQRQISGEGFSSSHDDNWLDGEMVDAAMCYLYARNDRRKSVRDENGFWLWPWATEWFKPGDYKRNLVKAGALIAADLDRVIRLEQQETTD